MLKTFLSELMTQSKTALSLGTRLMVFKGRSTRRTRRDFMVARFSPPELPLEEEDSNIEKVIMISRGSPSGPPILRTTKTRGFSTNTQSRFASVVFDCILGPLPLSSTLDSVLGFSLVPEATHESNRRAPCQLKGLFELTRLPSRALDGHEAVTERKRREKSLTFIFFQINNNKIFPPITLPKL